MKRPRLYLSYSSEDREWTESLAGALTRADAEVWFDALELKQGQDWQDALIRALKTSDIYAIVVGRRTLSNMNVLFEMGVARGADKPVIPIIIEPIASPELIDKFAHIVTVRDSNPDSAAEKLLDVANRLARKKN